MRVVALPPLIVPVLAALLLAACGERLPTFDLIVAVTDTEGRVLAAAEVVIGDRRFQANAAGEVSVEGLTGPAPALVRAEGYLTEPLPLGWGDADARVPVALYDDRNGARWVMHSAGDAMIGRRYESPKSGEPLVPADDKAGGALRIVGNVMDSFAVADLRTVNLETTVSVLPPEAAYPGKRFILNTPPEALSALQALGADVVILANNHVNDYKEEGLAQTLAALDGHGLKHTGAGVDSAQAARPVITDVGGLKVGVLAWTSVTGSFVNDSYPTADAPVPDDLEPDEMWQYEERLWSFAGETLNAPAERRRIGEVWRLFSEAEPQMEPTEVNAAWGSIDLVYPEMQDWVARRGHGGAAMWSDAESTVAISALAEETDLVVVQLHSGFQYMWAASEAVRDNAYRAIDAGADIVICHHPHVLQGLEWYRGRLIAYSLGNFIFDQDFLATFPTVFLRTIWEGTELLEARLVPLEIQGYKPTVVTDRAARRTLRNLMEINMYEAESRRDPDDLGVRAYRIEPYPETEKAALALERHSARVLRGAPAAVERSMTLPPGITELEIDGLIDGRLGLPEQALRPALLVGKDTFGWGRFEDETADDEASGSTHWVVTELRKRVVTGDAWTGRGFLQLTRYAPEEQTVIRPVARVTLPEHRVFDDGPDGPVPADPLPSYTLRFQARLEGGGVAGVRFDLYEFDDTNPTEDPSSVLLDRIERTVELTPGAGWQPVEVDLADAELRSEGLRANMSTFYVTLAPPAEGVSTLDVDELAFIEWRAADALPPHRGAYTHVRNTGAEPIEIRASILPMGTR